MTPILWAFSFSLGGWLLLAGGWLGDSLLLLYSLSLSPLPDPPSERKEGRKKEGQGRAWLC